MNQTGFGHVMDVSAQKFFSHLECNATEETEELLQLNEDLLVRRRFTDLQNFA